MFNMHDEVSKYYKDHVRISKSDRDRLAIYRDTNLDRLNRGLDSLKANGLIKCEHPIDWNDQGSYAMHTMNQHPDNDYDLDEAVVFDADGIPADPCDARQRIADAFLEVHKMEGLFVRLPEARTNAVTIWYAAGHHIDFAVYRRYEENGAVVTEHAGPAWSRRDPKEINDWFRNEVGQRSPDPAHGAVVERDQLRRMVRLLKKFAKAHATDTRNMPGGLLISVLAAEQFRPNPERDDIALANTMRAVRDRLARYTEVRNPADPILLLTDKPKHVTAVTNLKERLDRAIEKLQVLDKSDCDRQLAIAAWSWVFKNDDYWSALSSDEQAAKSYRGIGLNLGRLEGAPKEVTDTGQFG